MKEFPEKFGFRSILAPLIKADIECARDYIATDRGLDDFEIPNEYEKFLVEWNGGAFTEEPSPTFRVDDRRYATIKVLFGVGPYFAYKIHLAGDEVQNAHKFDERVPKKYLAIGTGAPFEMLCTSTQGNDKGAIYFWCPTEEEREKVERTDKFLHLVAGDFLEFWNHLMKGDTFNK